MFGALGGRFNRAKGGRGALNEDAQDGCGARVMAPIFLAEVNLHTHHG